MSGNGYIRLYRKVLENPIVCKDGDHLAVWVYLLLDATHKERYELFGGRKILLQPGQTVTGRKKIAKALNVSESKIQRIIKLFESEQQIEQQTSSKNRLITVVNWQDYQSSEQQIEPQVNNKRTTSEHIQECNKGISNIYAQKFDQFYSNYPKKIAKQAALKAWQKLKPDDALMDKIMQGLERWKQSDSWLKDNGQYIPYPATWINQRRWEDEIGGEVKQKNYVN